MAMNPALPGLNKGRQKFARPPQHLMAALAAPAKLQPVGKPDVKAPATGPYQGAAGTEAQNLGQQRVPTADWATPGANYERRNYYVSPRDGSIIAREPGYYNPENPWDTGRPGESNGEFARTYGYGADAIAPYERRMDEPGVTPWGPGGKASAPGAFAAPGAGVSHPHQGGLDLSKALLGGPQTATGIEQGQDLLAGAGGEESPNEYLMQLLRGLLGKVPGAPSNAV
jgi:hypothetical protein